ncbi:uncharacterized protein si:dkeyp-72g9.4 [Betta splendens]|uniref:Uncharacterized protein si:dkeyp-72g9.4 n=1 Tax=Betta splendens TaxID=158456 RepID=A0A6P7NUL8_BETSP|nr:uncharacterized protein si:dkeyp-72g9.4 [Betta splendens]
MRPRSRLPSKRRLALPTITEGTEETLRDLNEANALHVTGRGAPVSSEDYLLSICHLAHPTFPTRDVSPDGIPARQPEAAHQRPRLSRLGASTPAAFAFRPTEEARAAETRERGGGTSDPLEYLYGHQSDLSGGVGFARRRGGAWDGRPRSRAHSIPCPSSPTPCQRTGSGRDIHTSATSPTDGSEGGGAEGKRQNVVLKPSLISQWISECRSAWREARVRACMLPAIAEI